MQVVSVLQQTVTEMEWSVSWGLIVEAWNWGSVQRQTVDEVQLVSRLQQTVDEVHLVWLLRLAVEAVLWRTVV